MKIVFFILIFLKLLHELLGEILPKKAPWPGFRRKNNVWKMFFKKASLPEDWAFVRQIIFWTMQMTVTNRSGDNEFIFLVAPSERRIRDWVGAPASDSFCTPHPHTSPRTKQNARPDTEPEYYATKYQIQKCRVKIHYGSLKNKCGENDLEGHFIKKINVYKIIILSYSKMAKICCYF